MSNVGSVLRVGYDVKSGVCETVDGVSAAEIRV